MIQRKVVKVYFIKHKAQRKPTGVKRCMKNENPCSTGESTYQEALCRPEMTSETEPGEPTEDPAEGATEDGSRTDQ